MTTLRAKPNTIRELRIKRGMSMRALSIKAGLSVATIFKIENSASDPSPSTAKKICDALGEKFESLFEIHYEEA